MPGKFHEGESGPVGGWLRRWRTVLGLVAVAALVSSLLSVSAGRIQRAEAATPSSGTVGPPDGTSVSWTGQTYVAAATADPALGGAACPAATDPANVLCDHFIISVSNVDVSYWDSHCGGVEVKITWASSDNDFDLYAYDASGQQVGSSAAGGTTSESFLIRNARTAAGPYEVRVVPFTVVNSGYDGTATFKSTDGACTGAPHETGGLVFGPATVVDAQRTEGEPLNFVAAPNDYWETGPFGTSTQQSWIHRSTDGGDQFNIIGPLRPDTPPGGGDTDIVVDDQGNAYFTDLEALANLDCAVSNDHGNTWRSNHGCVQDVGEDRQWYTIDNGTTPAATDNTVFLGVRGQGTLGTFIHSSPGSTGVTDQVGGLVFTNSANRPTSLHSGTRCGQIRFDPVNRNIYYGCSGGSRVDVIVGHANPGQRTGIAYTTVNLPPSPGGGSVSAALFPVVATDKGGNVYAAWVDGNDNNVYYTFAANPGTGNFHTTNGQGTLDTARWSPPARINGNDANSNVMPWIQGGVDGTIAVAWYGSPDPTDSDFMRSWFNDRVGSTVSKWFGYVAVIQGANSTSPTISQQRFTEKPMNYGQICTGGIGCSASGGDRTMADFFTIFPDPADGSLRVVYNDTTSQHHGAHLMEVRQLAGPTLSGLTINKPIPTNPVSDPTGDAQVPHYAPTCGVNPANCPNLKQGDFTKLELSQPDVDHLKVVMTLNDLSSLAPPTGKTNLVWLTRFQALSIGDPVGEEAYRIFYVGAESVNGATPTFFAGSGNAAKPDGTPGDGCIPRNPQECKIVVYPAEAPASGSIDPTNKTITITVPVQGGFGLPTDGPRPIKAKTLYSVTAFSLGRSLTNELYAELDSTRAFDFTLSAAGLSVTKTDSPDPVFAGQDLTYTVTVHNGGPDPAATVTVSDDLPAGVNLVSATANPSGSCSSGDPVVCSLGTLAAGADATVTIVVNTTASAVPSITNTATVSSTTLDPDSSDNTATQTTTVRPAADLSVAKMTDPPGQTTAHLGQPLKFTVNVTNNGPSDGTGITVTDTFTKNAGFASLSPGQWSCTAKPAKRQVVCTLATLASGQSRSFQLTVKPTQKGMLTNTATVTLQSPTDPNSGNNSAKVDVNVVP